MSQTLRKLRMKYDNISKMVKEKERELDELKVRLLALISIEKAGLEGQRRVQRGGEHIQEDDVPADQRGRVVRHQGRRGLREHVPALVLLHAGPNEEGHHCSADQVERTGRLAQAEGGNHERGNRQI